MVTDNGGIGKVDWWNGIGIGSGKWKAKLKWKMENKNEMKGQAKMEKLIKDQNGK